MGLENLVSKLNHGILNVVLSASLAFMPALTPACNNGGKDNKPPATTPSNTTPNNPQPPVAKADVSGNVFYSGTTIPVSGVTVSIDNVVNTTNSSGTFSLQDIVAGSKTLKAEKTGYDPYSQTINVQQGISPIDVEMTSAQFTFSLTGTVKSSGNNQVLSGVKVTILNPNNTPSKLSSTTDASGYYQVPTVPQGQRTVRFELSNYTTKDATIFIANTNNKYDLIMNSVSNIVLPADIFNNETLKTIQSPYIIDTDLTIKRGAKLTIEPGVEIKIASQKNIIVEGSLEVLGTSAQPVRFTTKISQPQTSDYWGSLIFNSSTLMQTTNLENLIIEYADKGIKFDDLGINASQMPTITQLKIQNCDTGIIFTGLRNYKPVLANISIDRAKNGVVVFYDDNSANNEYEFNNLTIENSTIGISYKGNISYMLNTGVAQDLSLILNNSTITTTELVGTGIIIPRLILNNSRIEYKNSQKSNGEGIKGLSFLEGTGNNSVKGYKMGIKMEGEQKVSIINIENCDYGIFKWGDITTIRNVIINNCDYGIFSSGKINEVESCKITNCRTAGIASEFQSTYFPKHGVISLKNSLIDNCGDIGVMMIFRKCQIINSIISNNNVGVFNDYPGFTSYYSGGSQLFEVSNSRFTSNNYAIMLVGAYNSYIPQPIYQDTEIINSIFNNNAQGIVGGSGSMSFLSNGLPSGISFNSLQNYRYANDIGINYCSFIGVGNHLLNDWNESRTRIRNSIFWSDNINNPPFGDADGIIDLDVQNTYIWLYDPQVSGHIDPITRLPWVVFNLANPMFIDPANGNYRLQSSSPAKTASSAGGEIGAYGNGGSPP